MLFPQPSPDSFKNPAEAILYRMEHVDSCWRFELERVWGRLHKLPVFCFRNLTATKCKVHFESILAELRMTRLVSDFPSHNDWHDNIMGDDSSVMHREAADPSKEPQRNSEECDCIIYVVDLLRFGEDDMADMLASLSCHHQLLIAGIVDSKIDESSRFECLVKFMQRLGDFDKSPLANLPMNWMLWCIKDCRPKLSRQLRELIKWACYDVISNRTQSDGNGDDAMSGGEAD